MNWRLACAFIAMTSMPLYAADAILPQPRKKFHLHMPGIAFKALPANPTKRIAQPGNQSIGIMVQSEPQSYLELRADFSPPLTLPGSRYTWSGAVSGQGASIPVAFGSEGDRTINLTIADSRQPDKTSAAAVKVRFVSPTTEGDLCASTSPSTVVLCSLVFADAEIATAWAISEIANLRWGWAPHVEPRDNGRSNAAKHAYWSLLLTRDFGATTARLFTDAHERDPLVLGAGLNDGSPHNGVVMDLDNNLRGRQIASGMTFTTSIGDDPDGQDAIVAAILAGTLTVMDDASPTTDGNANRQGLLQASYP